MNPTLTKKSDPAPPAAYRRRLWTSVAWLAGLVAALLLDSTVSEWANQHPLDKHSRLSYWMKAPGDYALTLVVIAFLIVVFRLRGLRAAGHIALAGLCGGSFYCILKWTVGRRRPGKAPAFEFKHFIDGWPGFLRAENLSFPSGHVTFAFATAAVLGIHFPKTRWILFTVASAVAIERVWENAHYLADVVAGAMIGILSAYLIVWIFAAIDRKRSSRGFDSTHGVDGAEGSRRIMNDAARASSARTAEHNL